MILYIYIYIYIYTSLSVPSLWESGARDVWTENIDRNGFRWLTSRLHASKRGRGREREREIRRSEMIRREGLWIPSSPRRNPRFIFKVAF